jgi:hypothetical protein
VNVSEHSDTSPLATKGFLDNLMALEYSARYAYIGALGAKGAVANLTRQEVLNFAFECPEVARKYFSLIGELGESDFLASAITNKEVLKAAREFNKEKGENYGASAAEAYFRALAATKDLRNLTSPRVMGIIQEPIINHGALWIRNEALASYFSAIAATKASSYLTSKEFLDFLYAPSAN